MTLVCCWLDKSFGRTRITALADTRSAELRGTVWYPRSEQTLKLFRIRIECHRLSDLDSNGTGDWRKPYFKGELGIGFAGYCFEAMTIIALFSRAMEQLVSEGDDPRPTPDGMTRILGHITQKYFVDHTNKQAQHVQFLLFGYTDEEPWIAKLGFGSNGPTGPGLTSLVADQVYAIGDAGDTAFTQFANEILERISKHSESVNDQKDEADTERARHKDAGKKLVEETVIEKIENEFSRTVGGFVQKLEVYPRGKSGAAAYTRESRSDILDFLPEAGVGLRYMPVGEPMGRKHR